METRGLVMRLLAYVSLNQQRCARALSLRKGGLISPLWKLPCIDPWNVELSISQSHKPVLRAGCPQRCSSNCTKGPLVCIARVFYSEVTITAPFGKTRSD